MDPARIFILVSNITNHLTAFNSLIIEANIKNTSKTSDIIKRESKVGLLLVYPNEMHKCI